MSYTHSKKWLSRTQREQHKWRGIDDGIRRHFADNPYTPRSYTEWVDFQLQERKTKLEERLRREEALKSVAAILKIFTSSSNNRPSRHQAAPRVMSLPFNGKNFRDGRGAVLGMPTIWRNGTDMYGNPIRDPFGRDYAPWPRLGEYKWEGDDRARSGVGRFLPIPRAGGNETVAWHQRPVHRPLDFDMVRAVPTLEDVHFPVEEIPADDVSLLLGDSLIGVL